MKDVFIALLVLLPLFSSSFGGGAGPSATVRPNLKTARTGRTAARTAAQLDLVEDLPSVSCLLKRKVVLDEGDR